MELPKSVQDLIGGSRGAACQQSIRSTATTNGTAASSGAVATAATPTRRSLAARKNEEPKELKRSRSQTIGDFPTLSICGAVIQKVSHDPVIIKPQTNDQCAIKLHETLRVIGKPKEEFPANSIVALKRSERFVKISFDLELSHGAKDLICLIDENSDKEAVEQFFTQVGERIPPEPLRDNEVKLCAKQLQKYGVMEHSAQVIVSPAKSSKRLKANEVYCPVIASKFSINLLPTDIDRLDEGEFLNDSLMEFFSNYMVQYYAKEAAHVFHIFNTFFYQQLSAKEETKKPSGEVAFQRVRRWTNKIDIFQKEMVFVPICESMHWYLAVIWNPKAYLAKNPDSGDPENLESVSESQSVESDLRKNCYIFLFDSLLGKHPTVPKVLGNYLRHEAKDKLNAATLEKDPPVIYAKVHRQPNHCDCGVFVLFYFTLLVRSQNLLVEAVLKREQLSDKGFGTVDEIVSFRRLIRAILETEKKKGEEMADMA